MFSANQTFLAQRIQFNLGTHNFNNTNFSITICVKNAVSPKRNKPTKTFKNPQLNTVSWDADGVYTPTRGGVRVYACSNDLRSDFTNRRCDPLTHILRWAVSALLNCLRANFSESFLFQLSLTTKRMREKGVMILLTCFRFSSNGYCFSSNIWWEFTWMVCWC